MHALKHTLCIQYIVVSSLEVFIVNANLAQIRRIETIKHVRIPDPIVDLRATIEQQSDPDCCSELQSLIVDPRATIEQQSIKVWD